MNAHSDDAAFSASQYDDAYPAGVERSFWHVARNTIIEQTLRDAGMAQLPLLEIGCGRGIIVDHLRGAGFDCIGCDLARPHVDASLSGTVFTGTDFHALDPAHRERVRGVLLCDVIEHLDRPADFLGDVVRTFPALSHVLVTVPARRELWSKWDEHFGHFRRYSRATLEQELSGAGLSTMSLGYFFHALYAPMFLARGGRRSTRSEAPKAAALHRLLGQAFVLERAMVPRWVPGSSLIATARVNR